MLLLEPVLQHFSSYGAWDVHCPGTLCWRCFVHSSLEKLIYNTVLAGISGSLFDRLLSVLNAAAVWLVVLTRLSEHDSSLPSVTFTGWKNRVSSLCSDAPLSTWHCATLHSNRLLTCLLVVIFGLPQCQLWSSHRPHHQTTLGYPAFPVAAWNAFRLS